ncbi:MAG: hypothetical protein JXB07_14000, partial [Anaerolineae bacterium]|nr:hypothetical protein [Anaerolineae bacterium]
GNDKPVRECHVIPQLTNNLFPYHDPMYHPKRTYFSRAASGMLCVSVDSRLRGNDKLVRECHVIPQHVHK